MLRPTLNRLALAILLGSPLGAAAQALPAPPREGQPREAVEAPQRAPERDVLQLDLGATIERHSNVFNLANKVDDTVIRGLLGVRFDRSFSLQRLRAEAALQPVKYLDNSSFDFLGMRIGATWDFEVGRPLFGQISGRFARQQTPFDQIDFGLDNLQDVRLVRALVGWRFTPDWAVFMAADQERLDNSIDAQRANDYTFTGFETGVRYTPPTARGLELDLLWRQTDGEYPNRQVFNAVGQALPGGIDNAFDQQAVLARLGYRPNEHTRIGGQAGYTRREHDNLPQRDFSGPTLGLEFEFLQAGAIRWRIDLVRAIESDNSLTASYADTRAIAVRPTWRLTGRTSVVGLLAYTQRDFEGDPGFVLSGQPVRSDKLREIGARLEYEVARNWIATLELRRLDRSSNYQAFEFTDNVVGVGFRFAF